MLSTTTHARQNARQPTTVTPTPEQTNRELWRRRFEALGGKASLTFAGFFSFSVHMLFARTSTLRYGVRTAGEYFRAMMVRALSLSACGLVGLGIGLNNFGRPTEFQMLMSGATDAESLALAEPLVLTVPSAGSERASQDCGAGGATPMM